MFVEDKCIIKAKDVEAKVIDDETLILEPKTGSFFRLNNTGTEVWKNANGKVKLKDIAKKIAAKYDVSEKKALSDVIALVEQMKKKKLVVF
jgi:hypothetical protein